MRASLIFTHAPMAELYHITIALVDAPRPIIRKIQVPATVLLSDFHRIVQAAMGWRDMHLHEFALANKRYTSKQTIQNTLEWGSPEDIELIDESTVALNQLLRKTGDEIAYLYDFGDDWEHKITLTERSLSHEIIVLTHAEGRCPPEDVGGVWGYKTMLEAFAKPKNNAEAEEYKLWLGIKQWDADDVQWSDIFDRVLLEHATYQTRLRSASLIKTTQAPRDAMHTPIVPMVLALLNYLQTSGPTKLTAKGWLPKNIVQAMFDAYDNSAFWEEAYIFDNKVPREEENMPVLLSRKLAQHAGFVKVSKGKIELTAKGNKHLPIAAHSDLYKLLLKAAITKLLWHQLDGHAKLPQIQQTFPDMLVWLIGNNDYVPISALIELILLWHPEIYQEVQDNYFEPEEALLYAWLHRVETIARLFNLLNFKSSTRSNAKTRKLQEHDLVAISQLAREVFKPTCESFKS